MATRSPVILPREYVIQQVCVRDMFVQVCAKPWEEGRQAKDQFAKKSQVLVRTLNSSMDQGSYLPMHSSLHSTNTH